VPNDVALALFRVMQEAVRNAVKHSGARSVSIALIARNHEIELDVTDAGVGFDPEAIMISPGLGLIAMRERLGLVNGACAIEARPGQGTRIRARVPLYQPAVV
jgi:signal transduction histidine kinase